jgi:non-ribosomal peptide synthase protein (TIGR01720 family)
MTERSDLLQRLTSLSFEQRRLLARRLQQSGGPERAKAPASVARSLTAYLVPEPGVELDPDRIRQDLQRRLPDYMVPSQIMTLDSLPLTPNGKLDRQALPDFEPDPFDFGPEFEAPRSALEQQIAAIWAEALHIEQIGVHDNFFEIGGDSLISIRVIARIREAGLELSAPQLFENPTIAQLAQVVGTGPQPLAEQGQIQGAVPLTPIQAWFFEGQHPEPAHWNQGVPLEVSSAVSLQDLQQALDRLVEHHDLLRAQYVHAEGIWRQEIQAESDMPAIVVHDLSALSDAIDQEIERRVSELHASLRLDRAPLLKAAYFDLGQNRANQLVLIVHHLVIDHLSVQLIVDDLNHLCQDPAAILPAKTTSYSEWAQRLHEFAQSETLKTQAQAWLQDAVSKDPALPLDFAVELDVNTVASEQAAVFWLSEHETTALLQQAHEAYKTRPSDLLIAALQQSLMAWTGYPSLRIGMEGHGREPLFEDIDLSRTVGWFTAYYPLLIHSAADASPGELIKTVKERIRAIPDGGIGYGLLRYLCEEAQFSAPLQASSYPQIVFNYLGRASQADPDKPLRLLAEAPGQARSQAGMRRFIFELNTHIQAGRLGVRWTYSQNLHTPATISRLGEAFMGRLQTLIAHCLDPAAGGFTPSDFPLADLDGTELNKLAGLLGSQD